MLEKHYSPLKSCDSLCPFFALLKPRIGCGRAPDNGMAGRRGAFSGIRPHAKQEFAGFQQLTGHWLAWAEQKTFNFVNLGQGTADGR